MAVIAPLSGGDETDKLTVLTVYKQLEALGHTPVLLSRAARDDENLSRYCEFVSSYDGREYDAVVVCACNIWEAFESLDCDLVEFLEGKNKKIAFCVDTTLRYVPQLRSESARRSYLHSFSAISTESEIDEVSTWLKSALAKPRRHSALPVEKQYKSPELIEYKIQNLLFPDCDWKDEHRWMFYRGEKMKYDSDTQSWTLPEGHIECFTYFNSLSVRKWDRYANAVGYKLHLKVRGKFKLHFFGHWLESRHNKLTLDEQLDEIRGLNIGDVQKRNFIHKLIREADIRGEKFAEYAFDTLKQSDDGVAEIVLPAEYANSSVLSFGLTADGPCEIYGGYWTAECVSKQLNTVNISLCTTTFKKEEYILPNLQLIRDEIFELANEEGGMDELKEHFYVNVVDNGRTLETADVESYRVKLHPNPNTGGAGGFTRGMLETIALRERGEFDATHVLFMDDDVKILPESLKRTYALLRLLKEEYKDHFISGAMLDIKQMNEQFEDLGFCSEENNSCGPLKPRYALHLMEDILRNEEGYSLNNAYAAWWYCCVPMQYIGNDKLSYPIFYRGDDVNFSLRNNARILTMNGICIWHMMLNGKVTTSLEFYLANRNLLMIQALDDLTPKISYLNWIKDRFSEELRKFNYIACDEALDALADFLKGPRYIEQLPHEFVIKSHNIKNEKFVSIDKFKNIDVSKAYEYVRLNTQDTKLFVETDNGHTLPEYLLRDTLPVVAHLFFESPGKQFLQRRILAVDVNNNLAIIHTMDRERYVDLKNRYRKLLALWENTINDVLKDYRLAAPRWRSKAFWEAYFERNS